MDFEGMSIEEVRYLVVFITTEDQDEGAKIAKALVEEEVVACVNMIKEVSSVFKWKGKVEEEAECLLVVKTRTERFHELVRRVKELHSYDVPEVIALPIVEGNTPYLQWIDEVT